MRGPDGRGHNPARREGMHGLDYCRGYPVADYGNGRACQKTKIAVEWDKMTRIDEEANKMAKISIDNGRTYMTAGEAMPEILEGNLWPVVEQVMDDDTREQVHNEIAPCTELEFLARYLEIAPHDLVIG